jgi:hypothetical protein
MLPQDFTPEVLDEPAKPHPGEMPSQPPTEIPEPPGPQPPSNPYPVHPEPAPAPAPPEHAPAAPSEPKA